ncbi:hypothetical protein QN277_001017 [Acacia crassicarpa]|uniref:Dof zinc finger protein n=1 Tax=Acacia crassicarpa TaxID=499986 RepID=A0AAE1N8Z2_9FABA|nr:hypothetical protein QN277_001017 [Acacia crassicarpa]
MVFSSFPPYHLDPPPNWPHQQLDHQQPEGLIHAQGSQVPPPPPPLPVADAGDGTKGSTRPGSMADRARLAKIAQPEGALKCPRCESTNTKFCYYNNYNLSQPRHFCKTCRRYWTQGGALRNVPVGGGCRRKNKRIKGTNSRKSSKSPNKAASTSGHHLLPSPPLLFPPPPTTSHTSYSDYDVVFGATNIRDAEFQIACNNNIIGNNNINGFISTTEQWKLPSLLQHHQQFPSTFLSNLEAPPVGLYHQFERSENNAEIIEPSTKLLYSGGSGNIGSDHNHHHLQLTTTVKMEENMDQVLGLSKSLTGNSENNNNNEQFWEANNNGSAWNINNVSISFASSSSSAATHLV